MNSNPGRNVSTSEDSYKGPITFLVVTILLGILTMTLAATLLRKPVETDPFDKPAAAAEPEAPRN